MNDDMPRSPDASAVPDGDDAMEGSVADPLEGWDAERARCPVTRNAASGWNVLGHAEILEVLHDHETFSNEVSAHLSVPNGMDPPAHGPYVCPGAPLARLELRVVVEELLERTSAIELDPDRDVPYAEPPKGGFERVPVRIDPR